MSSASKSRESDDDARKQDPRSRSLSRSTVASDPDLVDVSTPNSSIRSSKLSRAVRRALAGGGASQTPSIVSSSEAVDAEDEKSVSSVQHISDHMNARKQKRKKKKNERRGAKQAGEETDSTDSNTVAVENEKRRRKHLGRGEAKRTSASHTNPHSGSDREEEGRNAASDDKMNAGLSDELLEDKESVRSSELSRAVRRALQGRDSAQTTTSILSSSEADDATDEKSVSSNHPQKHNMVPKDKKTTKESGDTSGSGTGSSKKSSVSRAPVQPGPTPAAADAAAAMQPASTGNAKPIQARQDTESHAQGTNPSISGNAGKSASVSGPMDKNKTASKEAESAGGSGATQGKKVRGSARQQEAAALDSEEVNAPNTSRASRTSSRASRTSSRASIALPSKEGKKARGKSSVSRAPVQPGPTPAAAAATVQSTSTDSSNKQQGQAGPSAAKRTASRGGRAGRPLQAAREPSSERHSTSGDQSQITPPGQSSCGALGNARDDFCGYFS